MGVTCVRRHKLRLENITGTRSRNTDTLHRKLVAVVTVVRIAYRTCL